MMQPHHTLEALFAQLGLPNDESSIDAFIKEHPLNHGTRLDKADWWNPGQQAFLQEAYAEDSDWVIVIEHLDALLRHD